MTLTIKLAAVSAPATIVKMRIAFEPAASGCPGSVTSPSFVFNFLASQKAKPGNFRPRPHASGLLDEHPDYSRCLYDWSRPQMSKNVLLAVTGSIAAFKSAALASELVKHGFDVRAVLSRGGTRFVTSLTFEALTGNPVAVEVWDEHPGATAMGHLELARWADVMVVCPASAGSIARLALGLADDMLGSVALASSAPMIVVPAMESGMFQNAATQQHLETLRSRGATIVGPTTGRLASGSEGVGRMEEPEAVLQVVIGMLEPRGDLEGRRILVTAGPTFEQIDKIRFIGNRSSGKMGFAVAREAANRGAHVLLIAGPTSLAPPADMGVVRVETADEMRNAVLANLPGRDVVVMAAAVGDFRPDAPSSGKLRRSGGLTLQLSPTPDIAAEAAAAAPGAIHVGFALETQNLRASARDKMERKRQQMIVANEVSEEHDPFGADTNRVLIITPDREIELPEMRKADIARRIWDEILKLLTAGTR
jgi:phosphopantothenoylcysteine decarboxylase / phosphopantothenate---cysteine ligase